MEDFEKYVFDPENPTAFKAYDLLLKLSEQKPNAAFFDPNFFCEIYQKQFFDEDFKKRLWNIEEEDKEHFDELEWTEKKRIYEENYSENDFWDYLDEKTQKIITTPYIFNKAFFSVSIPKSKRQRGSKYSENWSFDNHFNNLETLKNIKEPQATIKLDSNYNSIFLLTKEYFNCLKSIKLDKSIVLITTVKDCEKLEYQYDFEDIFFEKRIIVKRLPFKDIHTVKYIILKKKEDINLLFNFLKLDKANQPLDLKTEQKTTSPLKTLTLKNYFTIKNIQLENLQDKKEIYFLGKNGVGKTKLLQAILLAIRGNPNEGIVSDVIKENPNKGLSLISKLEDGTVFKYLQKPKKDAEIYKNIIAYGVNRFRNDSEQKDDTGFLTLFDEEQYLNSPVQWLKYLDYKELKQDFSGISLERAKELIKDILDDITEIEVSPDGVIFYEKGVAKSFKALSDGFKTLIIWICDMTIRLAEKQTNVSSTKDFYGIVIVDEIGMFLHPTWQYSLMEKLRKKWFPNIQFIFTTHSPVEILGASRDAVFYKLYKEDGITKVSKPVENKSISHLMLNGIVTAPFLFGLPSAKQAAFDEEKDTLDTSDDYYIGRIREELLKRVTEKEHVNQEDIMNLLSDAFDEVEKDLILNDKD